MHTTLFPDYFALDETCCQHRAEMVMEKLRQIPIDFLSSHAERNTILRRLQQAQVFNLAQLLQLPRYEVQEWEGVGPFFLHIFDELRQEVRRQPEQIIKDWSLTSAEWEFPCPSSEEDPWSIVHYLTLPSLPPANDSEAPLSGEALMSQMLQVEETFTHIILLLMHRWDTKAAVLHRYMLQGLSPEVIVRVLGLASRSAVMHVVEHYFLRPLLRGEAVAGIRLSTAFRQNLAVLRDQLTFRPIHVLEGLNFMSFPRFLLLLGLTPMVRSQAETAWACDLIVGRGQVLASRALLHNVFRQLQLHPDYQSLANLRQTIGKQAQHNMLLALLMHHPWIEHQEQAYRLRAEQLCYDFSRVGRILLEAQGALSRGEMLMRYEHFYLERPQSLSMSQLRKRFPAITSPQQGLWQWLPTQQASKKSPVVQPIILEPTLFD